MNRIREIRESKGIKQKELALLANISAPYLHDLERSARGAKPETWDRIAKALDVKVEELQDEQKAG